MGLYTHVGVVHNGRCEKRPYLSAANMNEEEILDLETVAREELVSQIGYLGNVLIVFIVSMLVIGVAGVYYCCLKDEKRNTRDHNTRFTRTERINVTSTPYGTL